MHQLHCTLSLPSYFRIEPILAFYQRDPLAIAEKVNYQTKSFCKGVMWLGQPAYLDFTFKTRTVKVILTSDQPLDASNALLLEKTASNMLGLKQSIEIFEQNYQNHKILGPLIQKYRGLRIPVTATPFEALTRAIIGQQISLKAATSLYRKFIQLTSIKQSMGLWCYPNAAQVMQHDKAQLRQIGFSTNKAQTMLSISQAIEEGRLPLDKWTYTLPIDIMTRQLLSIKGIGGWTLNYTLLRGFGWLDSSLHQDAGIQRSLQILLNTKKSVSSYEAEHWLLPFSPWRALVANYLWHFLQS